MKATDAEAIEETMGLIASLEIEAGITRNHIERGTREGALYGMTQIERHIDRIRAGLRAWHRKAKRRKSK